MLAGGFPGIRVRLHGSEALGEAVLDEPVPGGERYARLTDDGAVRERVNVEALSDPLAGYTRRHYEALSHVIGGEDVVDLPRLADGYAAQAILDAALGATERWATVAGPDAS